jgi:hypothetical protein
MQTDGRFEFRIQNVDFKMADGGESIRLGRFSFNPSVRCRGIDNRVPIYELLLGVPRHFGS